MLLKSERSRRVSVKQVSKSPSPKQDRDIDEDSEQSFIPPSVLLEEGEKIKLKGTKTAANYFQANEVRPWGGNRGPGKRHGQRQVPE